MRQYFASDFAYGVNPQVAGLFIIPPAGTGSSGAQTYTVPTPGCVAVGGINFSPLATNAPVNLGTDTNLTPSAVNLIPNSPSTFTVTVTAAHGSGTLVSSYTCGLQEALNQAAGQTGGAVVVDGKWASLGGTTAMITGAANPSGSAVFIIDDRGSALTTYVWNGSAFTASGGAASLVTANGASITYGTLSENLTLSTGGTTTDTTAKLLPANSVILGVVFRVTTTIATATGWQPGDPTTAGRFGAAQTGGQLTAGATFNGGVFNTTGIASATTGTVQTSAASVRITTTGTPSAGAIRITSFYYTLVPPTS